MAGLDEFKKFLGDFKSLSSLTAKGAAAAPLADYFLRLGPPWPAYAIPAATTVIELVSIVSVFQFFRHRPALKLNRDMIILIIVFCITSFLYLGMTSSYTFRHPKTRDLVVKGFELTPETRRVVGPAYTAEDALKGNRYDPEGVWTDRSITAMRLSLIAIWLIMFVSLSSFLGMFVIVQQRT